MIVKRTCAICGKEFETRYTRQLTCSKECAEEKAKRWMLEYKAKHKDYIKARRHAYYVKHRDPNTKVRGEHGNGRSANLRSGAITGGGKRTVESLSAAEILEVERVYKTVPAINRWPIVSKWCGAMREYLRLLCKDNYGISARDYLDVHSY